MENKFPVKLLRSVHCEFFITPSYEEFRDKTVWSLENAFTTALKELKLKQQYQACQTRQVPSVSYSRFLTRMI
jgi:hypothetical protein